MSKESDRPDDAEHLPLRFQILSKEAVEEILEEHFAWLITKSDHGQRADLSWALLRGAQLEAVDLVGADLEEADLEGANFLRTNLHWAKLADAGNLTQNQIDIAHGNAGTRIPSYLSRPPQWEKTGGDDTPPPIPIPSSAPIKTTVEGDRVVLDDGAEPDSDTDRADLEIHWGELKRDAEDLSPRLANAPRLVRRVRDFSDALGDGADGFNEILLGLRGVALGSAVARAEKELYQRP